MAIKWHEAAQKPPQNRPILLILANFLAVGLSEVEVGFWDGHEFRFTRGQQDQAKAVTRWALLEPLLPRNRKSAKA
jgi:hypothetical protein